MRLLAILSKRHLTLVSYRGRHNYMIPNIKKLVSNVFSFGASLH